MSCLNNDLLTNLDHANCKSEHRDHPSVWGELLDGMGNWERKKLALSAFKQKSEEHNPKKESTILRRKKNPIS